MVMGIAHGEDFLLVSTFCFTFPDPGPNVPVQNGHIHSQTIVSTAGHKFLVLNHSDLMQRNVRCEDLVKKAKVIEPLTERSKEVIAYDLTLNVEASMNRQHIAAVIARCGQSISAEYIVEFTSPGGLFEKQFACADQGLLSTYLWFAVLAGALSPVFYFAFRVLQRRQAHNDISAIFFAASGFFGMRIVLFSVHLMVYAKNGMGLGMMAFIAQFLDYLSTCMVTVVVLAIAHGVYVTRPNVPVGSEERRQLLFVLGGFFGTYLMSALVCGFDSSGELTPFGMLHGAASWPYIGVRLMVSLFCFNKGFNLAKQSEGLPIDKRQFLLKFSVIFAVWLASSPLIMMLSTVDSWQRDAFRMEVANFAAFGTLLYYFWPTRYGWLFTCMKPTERMHPYAEFGLNE
jgi:hypothetical protein